MSKIINWSRRTSPWIIHFNAGGCNGCDIELVAVLTPRFDVERFGILLKGTPRHADVLMVTGPANLQIRDRVRRIYDQMPNPKFVVAIGACAISGGIFRGCYNTLGGMDEIMPVTAYIPGCPPRPDAIIQGVAALIEKLRKGD
ncbi:MAG: NADH-quinone oxidoreductase subunit B family protein [Coprothermobacterota bacterium]|nr:NADH-quinone oxidoreductase subunit B family protein [Coprothermobacterota bacterium]